MSFSASSPPPFSVRVRTLLASARPVWGNPGWWRGQMWLVSVDVVVAFVTVIGLGRGIGLGWSAAGLAAVFALNGALLAAIVRNGRIGGWLCAVLALIGATLSVLDGGVLGWMGLLLACGSLMGIRDTEMLEVLVRLPVRAGRSRNCIAGSTRAEYTLSVVNRVVATLAFGMAASMWDWFPNAVLFAVLAVGVPAALATMPTSGRPLARMARGIDGRRINARFRVGLMLSACYMVGHRLVVPVVLAGAVASLGGDGTLVWFGVAVAVVALAGLVGGQLFSRFRPSGKTSVEMCVLCWLVLVFGLLIGGPVGGILVLAGISTGDVFGRFWGSEHMNDLREISSGVRKTAARRHRRVLALWMARRSQTGAVAMGMAALMLPMGALALPVLIGGASTAAWINLRRQHRIDLFLSDG